MIRSQSPFAHLTLNGIPKVVVPLAAVALCAAVFFLWLPSRDALVVYCAHDALYSEEILRQFERETGIPVEIRFDTEATKSLGLVELLLREKENPRCDVFWNNQVAGTMDLQDAGLLVPYRGSGHERIPERFKDPEGHWTGFAARMRVIVVHRDRVDQEKFREIDRLLAGDLSRVALAKPLYGTTFTHFAHLCEEWGLPAVKKWHADIQKRGVRVVGGNATVKNLVAEGVCDLGWTDTDDVFVAIDDEKPVNMTPVRVDGRTICIPNSVAIIKGTDRQGDAERLVDYLLSAETELALAKSKARQIPLGAVDESKLPEAVRRLRGWAEKSHPAILSSESRQATLKWLKSEYVE